MRVPRVCLLVLGVALGVACAASGVLAWRVALPDGILSPTGSAPLLPGEAAAPSASSSHYAQAELLESHEWAEFIGHPTSGQADLDQAAAFVELQAEVEVAGEQELVSPNETSTWPERTVDLRLDQRRWTRR